MADALAIPGAQRPERQRGDDGQPAQGHESAMQRRTLSYLRTKYLHEPPMVPSEQLADCKNEDFYLTYRTIVLLEEAISIDRAASVDWTGADRLEDRARLVARTGVEGDGQDLPLMPLESVIFSPEADFRS